MDTFSYHAQYSASESTVVPHGFLSVITQTCTAQQHDVYMQKWKNGSSTT